MLFTIVYSSVVELIKFQFQLREAVDPQRAIERQAPCKSSQEMRPYRTQGAWRWLIIGDASPYGPWLERMRSTTCFEIMPARTRGGQVLILVVLGQGRWPLGATVRT